MVELAQLAQIQRPMISFLRSPSPSLLFDANVSREVALP
jgi:hypothetical protein